MQLKIEFDLPHGPETLTVALINNPGVVAWAEHCRKIPTTRSVSTQPVAPPRQRPLTKQSDLWTQQQLVQSSLAPTRMPLPMPVSEPEQITQQHLNAWHRWFTDNTRVIGTENKDYEVEFHWLHEVNQIVHRLENNIWEWPKDELGIVGHELNLQPEIDQHGFGRGFVDLTPYRQYHSWEYADLILDQAVHGKTTMQSFIDNDDPKSWDTTGHHISWGGCKLVNGTYRQSIYQGNLFQRWMNQNNVTHQDLWGDYPLGHVVNRDQQQIDRIFRYQARDFASINLTVLE